MDTVVLDHLRTWIGNSRSDEDVISVRQARLMAATVDYVSEDIREGEPLPPLWHWIYFLEGLPTDALGRDGHPARGGKALPGIDHHAFQCLTGLAQPRLAGIKIRVSCPSLRRHAATGPERPAPTNADRDGIRPVTWEELVADMGRLGEGANRG